MESISSIMPRMVFCILGNWSDFDLVSKTIKDAGFYFDKEESFFGYDDRMGESFDVSADRVNYSMTDEELQQIRQHKAVGYFLAPESKNSDELRNIAGKALMLIERLFNGCNVIALKCESAGIAHGKSRWVELSKKYKDDPENALLYFYLAFVRRPIESEYGLYSCGMHLLGLPDILYFEGNRSDVESVKNMDQIAKLIMSNNGVYKKTIKALKKTDIEVNETKILPDEFHEEDTFMYNPYGFIYVDSEIE
ncbi:hypothetical protein M2451_000644 [Dysgonomonas sp. PFB1-18]|uniref:hypothetical protein n=1 Tax=unclassified Dysgonomonas TaxID=2630389 RepID=UPI002475B493|nr:MULTISPECIES: hypothetical protein [unclassified Dysgonomonas]MDH6307495.1 hypothetical protein [Dysgonomonas sp. PF1-14]MDH6337413.1 hypothetical protein [Dysgonomonas sp. PF1-16]MDH6379337.1 hypothetical protein [Dysgonomonas sp. PFB1-18]MDH6396025.1 hypothetical protein [Dysgonomonas sp. PF1-23]